MPKLSQFTHFLGVKFGLTVMLRVIICNYLSIWCDSKAIHQFQPFSGRVGEGDVSVENSWIFEVDGEIVKCLDCVKFLGTHEVSIF